MEKLTALTHNFDKMDLPSITQYKMSYIKRVSHEVLLYFKIYIEEDSDDEITLNGSNEEATDNEIVEGTDHEIVDFHFDTSELLKLGYKITQPSHVLFQHIYEE